MNLSSKSVLTYNKACVFNIQHYSVHDGPGIRTLVFFKGCPLSCLWCCNPESQSFNPELAYNHNKCVGIKECGRCMQLCPVGAITADEYGKVVVDHKKCTDCFDCVDTCPSGALIIFGKLMTVDEILQEVEKDSIFYARSQGGLTVTGGEPLSQTPFLLELLKEAKKRRLNTGIETSGFTAFENLLAVSEYLDFLFYDIKTLDPEKHKIFTGVSNELILDNLKELVSACPSLSITVRTPVVPGFNDNEEDIRAIAEFVKSLSGVDYELLGYHRLGEPKYSYIGRDYPLKGIPPLSKERLEALRKLIKKIMANHLCSV